MEKKNGGNGVASVDFDGAEFRTIGPKPRHNMRWLTKRYTMPFRNKWAFIHALMDFVPISKWLPKYQWRKNFLYDVISGLTTGVMFVPQGIAYSYLADVDPVYGLYSSFLAPFFYIFMGSSPHVSRGPSSVLGIMSGVSNAQIRKSYGEALLLANSSAILTTGDIPDNIMQEVPDPITVAATLTFTIGLLQLGMALMRLDFVSDYFCEPLIGGFTTAAAVHTLISQLGVLMGVVVPKESGPGYLFPLILALFGRLMDTNLLTLAISLGSIAFLMFGKEIVGPWMNKKSALKISLPYELMVMGITATLSYSFDWPTNNGIKAVGRVPRGLPSPKMPRWDLLAYCLPNAMAIGLVTLAMHFSMVNMLATQKHYSVDSAQELYAIGLGSTLSGCFPVYPTSTALGRTMVMVESGARSQLSSAISCLLLLFVILWLGPLFRPLPQCTLSAIIIVALRPIFRKSSKVLTLWRLSKYDAAIWIFSFVVTVLTEVIYGLLLSVAFTFFTVIVRTQWPIWEIKFSQKKSTSANYCIFVFEAPLIFTNAARFRQNALRGFNQWTFANQKAFGERQKIGVFIFDFATITQIDSVGLATLAKTVEEIRAKAWIRFVNCKDPVRQSLMEGKIVTDLETDFAKSVAEAIDQAYI